MNADLEAQSATGDDGSLSPEGQKLIEAVKSPNTDLPTLPSSVFELGRIADDPLASAKDFERVILTDPTLSAKVLHVANSAYYAPTASITNIRNAIVRIGMKGVQDLALSLSVIASFGTQSKVKEISMTELWRHSLAVAASASELARACPFAAAPEDAFTAGVLHDIGKAILVEIDPNLFVNVLTRANDRKLTFLQAEKVMFGVGHDHIGRLYAQRLHFPERLVVAIAGHHQPQSQTEHPTIDMFVHVADAIVNHLQIGDSGNAVPPSVSPGATARLGIEKSQLSDLIAKACSRIDEILEMLL